MKTLKWISLLVISFLSFSLVAQNNNFEDDVYFTPTNKKKEEPRPEAGSIANTTSVSLTSNDDIAVANIRDVDEYNRRYTSNEEYYIEEADTLTEEIYIDGELAQRIVKFEDPSKIVIVGADNVNIYYDGENYEIDFDAPSANVTANYYNVGFYSPSYFSPWYYPSWWYPSYYRGAGYYSWGCMTTSFWGSPAFYWGWDWGWWPGYHHHHHHWHGGWHRPHYGYAHNYYNDRRPIHNNIGRASSREVARGKANSRTVAGREGLASGRAAADKSVRSVRTRSERLDGSTSTRTRLNNSNREVTRRESVERTGTSTSPRKATYSTPTNSRNNNSSNYNNSGRSSSNSGYTNSRSTSSSSRSSSSYSGGSSSRSSGSAGGGRSSGGSSRSSGGGRR